MILQTNSSSSEWKVRINQHPITQFFSFLLKVIKPNLLYNEELLLFKIKESTLDLPETVLLPTPPLPDATAITLLTGNFIGANNQENIILFKCKI